jgi:pyruvate/2-oxoglutarate/acetoin dehydrogenase E1 component
MKRMTFQEAVVEAISEEMRRDDRVFHLGQDIGAFGGLMQSTKGLWEEFGNSGRIIDGPLSESAMMGACVGAAMMGRRPILQIMFGEFLPLVMHHLVHDAANAWYYTLGKARVPLVLRVLFGAGPHRAHPQNFESWFAHVPGLKVIMPSTPYDAKGLMKSAIRDDNPVLFLEHMFLYHGMRGEVPEQEYVVPIGRAEVKHEGQDVTVVATGMMVHRALNVAKTLSKEDISVEILDLRTIAPLDTKAVLDSVKKTGRLVVVHEAWKIGGIGAEVAGLVAEEAFKDLKGPIIRVGAPHIPIPASLPLEKMFLPNEGNISEAIRKTLAA